VPVERFSMGSDPEGAAVRVHSLARAAESVTEDVRAIIEDVREHGDVALRRYVERFDRVSGADLRVMPEELAAALDALDPDVRAGLELAIANVRAVAQADVGSDIEVALPQGQTVTLRDVPVRRAAIYVPGGRAPYPSTVVMGVVTGVKPVLP